MFIKVTGDEHKTSISCPADPQSFEEAMHFASRYMIAFYNFTISQFINWVHYYLILYWCNFAVTFQVFFLQTRSQTGNSEDQVHWHRSSLIMLAVAHASPRGRMTTSIGSPETSLLFHHGDGEDTAAAMATGKSFQFLFIGNSACYYRTSANLVIFWVHHN